jgi:hypothetical protein
MQERLIGDARSEFYDEWGMDEHMAAEYMGGTHGHGHHNANFDQQMAGGEDDEIQKAILESMKVSGGKNLEDEMLQRALEESRKMR